MSRSFFSSPPLPSSASASASRSLKCTSRCGEKTNYLPNRRRFATLASNSASPTSRHVHQGLTRQQVQSVFLSAAIPMVGFGFMDNFVMITVGSAIDNTLGVQLGLATMTAAAIGQVVSDVSGVVFGDTLSRIFRISPAKLNEMQRNSALVGRLRLGGAVVGVIVGCTLGAVALYLIPDRETDAADAAAAATSIAGSSSSASGLPLPQNQQERIRDQLYRLQQVMKDVMTKDDKWCNRSASCILYVNESMGNCIPKLPPQYSFGGLLGRNNAVATIERFLRDNNKDSAVMQTAREKRVVVFTNTIYVPIMADDNNSDNILGILKVKLENGSFYSGSEIQDAKRVAQNLGFFMNHMMEIRTKE
eukprot:CAMPEP_0168177990 /NCGR_PEP_ID=MMETSP0139_2-20121125/8820_1 /TAXON_ID=44445 /ORGANISM="Pseudo-nitzschia australis, Strain 10249 10 AB" /LENGTH=361 /DNA_ID=CAMNT_0008097221 /DNA_START=125 /DNA_END=1210 /DNA_ORIENTATION=-